MVKSFFKEHEIHHIQRLFSDQYRERLSVFLTHKQQHVHRRHHTTKQEETQQKEWKQLELQLRGRIWISVPLCVTVQGFQMITAFPTCQLLSEASWVLANRRCRVASFCSNICSLCKASWQRETGRDGGTEVDNQWLKWENTEISEEKKV